MKNKEAFKKLEAQAKPTPEPTKFKVEKVYSYQDIVDMSPYHKLRLLNTYEAMKEAIRDYLSGPTLGKSIETLRERMAIIDGYEGRR